jgi:elongation factor 3
VSGDLGHGCRSHLETKGDAAEWMLKQDIKIEDQQQLTDVTDAAGNKNEIKQGKNKLSKKEEKQSVKRIKGKIKNGEPLDSDEEELASEKDLL